MTSPDRSRRPAGLAVPLVLLFATGWAANHFASVIPLLSGRLGFGQAVLDAAFGIYAVGLLPGLLAGGGLSDRIGRRPVLLTGTTVAAVGNLIMLAWHTEPGIFLGRLVVGLGAGPAISAGTAWAGDLAGRRGSTLAGAVLTSGFAAGPLASGLIGQVLDGTAALVTPFAAAVAVPLLAALLALLALRSAPSAPFEPSEHTETPEPPDAAVPAPEGTRTRGAGAALAAALPMSLWVFSTATVPLVVLAGRMTDRYRGPWVPGVAAVIALGSGVLIQLVARRAGWGPLAGSAGAVLAAVGFGVAAFAGPTPALLAFVAAAVLLGSAYGLCLREGLLDVEALSPPARRGLVTGVFYVGTYLGFGVPLLLEALRPVAGIVTPLLVLAGLAAAAAVLRAVQVRTGRTRSAS